MVGHTQLEQLNSAVRGRDHEQVARIVEIHWGVLFRADSKALQNAIISLPEAVLDEHPVVGLIGEAYRKLIGRGRGRGDTWLTRTVELFDGLQDDRLRLSAGLVVVQALRRRGRYGESAEFGRRVADLAEELHDAVRPSDGPSAAAVHLYVGLSHLLAADLGRAEDYLHAAYRRTAPFANYAVDAAGKLAFLSALRGEPGPAQAWIDRAEEAAPEAEDWWLRGQEELIVDAAHALLAVDRLDWPTYHRHTRNALPFPTETWTFLLYVHARAALFLGNQRGMLAQLQAHRTEQPDSFPDGSLPRILLDTAQADLHLSLGNNDAAEQLVNPNQLVRHIDAHHPLELTSAARLCILTRRYELAEQLTDHATWPDHISRRGRINLSLLHATAKLRQHAHHNDLKQILRRAAAQMAGLEHPWLFILATADQDLIKLLPQAARETASLVREFQAMESIHPFAPKIIAPLTRRERIILEQLSRQLPVAQIAEELHVSPSTVKNQCTSLYRKLGATSRDHALEIAYGNGILDRQVGIVATTRAEGTVESS
jgi:LuxR family maltose regulon positive regulatory protein